MAQGPNSSTTSSIRVGVLALQGAFIEHIQLLQRAAQLLSAPPPSTTTTTAQPFHFDFLEVRTPTQLASCDALIIPGGESTTISLVAQRSGMLEPLRDFVKVQRLPTWGTCAGLILLSESANRTKAGGQELIGGLDVRVNRNHFGRQIESFQADLDLPFLADDHAGEQEEQQPPSPFKAIFIRAPVVEKLLPTVDGAQEAEAKRDGTVIAPSREISEEVKAVDKVNAQIQPVEVMAVLPGRTAAIQDAVVKEKLDREAGDIVAVRQGNVFGTSFHPELTGDARIHVWWLRRVVEAVERRRVLSMEER
ncbi:class I glutamine amidotransferase-like protein [Xylogone sp. PMI_703]|nr:class I glutamine amidotransferase-like protein [Xylogone sp. PMI_703]